jgi:hypothetical protein
MVDVLGRGLKFAERAGFVEFDEFVLDSIRKSTVKAAFQGGIAPVQLGGGSAEFNDVFVDLLILAHDEVFDVSFGVADRVVGSKVNTEFVSEFDEVSKPERNVILIFVEDVVLEPFECGPLEVGERVVYSGGVRAKLLGSVMKTELELDEESPEFAGVGSVEGIWVSSGFRAIAVFRGFCESIDGEC